MKATTDPKKGVTIELCPKLCPKNWWEDNPYVAGTLQEMIYPDSDAKHSLIFHALRSGGVYCWRDFTDGRTDFKVAITIEKVLAALASIGGRVATNDEVRHTISVVWPEGLTCIRLTPDFADLEQQKVAIVAARPEGVVVEPDPDDEDDEDDVDFDDTEIEAPPSQVVLTVEEGERLVVRWRPNSLLHFGTDPELLEKVGEVIKDFLEKTPVPVPGPKVIQTQLQMLSGTPLSGYSLASIGWERETLIRENYTDGILAQYDYALKELLAKEPAGRLLLLEGLPGGGKTRLVRAMMAAMNDVVRVVVVPSDMVADLSGPHMIRAFIGCDTPTILILEDADFALLSRDKSSAFEKEGSTKALAAVLNLSDGIIGARLDLRVIVTTNQKVENIDEAVTRDGRMLDRIHIDKLNFPTALKIIARQSGWDIERVAARMRYEPDDGEPKTSYWRKFKDPMNYMTLAEAYAVGNALKKEV